MSNYSYGIVTISDSCYANQAVDESGPIIKTLLEQELSASKITNVTVPDVQIKIEEIFKYYCDEVKVHCLFSTGGTGFAPRDVTPEATKNVIDRECPQLTLKMALESLKKTDFGALSRAVCGIRDKTLIINFPGNKNAVVECFQAIQSILPHAFDLIRDEKTKIVATHHNLQKDFKFLSPAEKSYENSSSISFTSSEVSEVLTISDLLDRSSSTMNEIVLEDDIMKLPTRSNVRTEQPFPIQSQQMRTEQHISIPIQHITAEKPLSLNASSASSETFVPVPKNQHACPHKTAKAGDKSDRNSPFPMLSVDEALNNIFASITRLSEPVEICSPMDCPSFRASIKDGYAVKSGSNSKMRKVIGYISAGDRIVQTNFGDEECFKINTGAPLPAHADAIVQIEDTKLISSNSDGSENVIELLELPKTNLDVRQIGSDVSKGEFLFETCGMMDVAEKTILASLGLTIFETTPKIAIISTGDELISPATGELGEGQIYDSNSIMLSQLLRKYGFDVKFAKIAKDDYISLKHVVEDAMRECDVIISSGGVSMGDKDFIKRLLKELGFEIMFGRVNMKPGKPMTFASNSRTSYFALPGNPVSAFVTFHIFVLPALRFMSGFAEAKCKLPTINVVLKNTDYPLDSRPEYARAKISYNKSSGVYFAQMSDNQISSRLISLVGADALLMLPGSTRERNSVKKDEQFKAVVINQHFLSEYES